MKLKTLNDLREKGIWLSEENAQIIKAEAIKWVKNMRNGIGDTELSEDNFMRFFNITEEDLK